MNYYNFIFLFFFIFIFNKNIIFFVDGLTSNSITKDNITWTFSENVEYGQFVNGDYFIIGSCTVISIDPEPRQSSPFMHGSVLNLPTSNGKSGFDSRLNDGTDESYWFDSTLRVYPPISLKSRRYSCFFN